MSLEDHLHASLGSYMRAPAWVRESAGRMYRMLPAPTRYGSRYRPFLLDARSALAEADWSTVEQRLDATLRAASHAPAYLLYAAMMRDARLAPLDRLRRLPLLTKAAIKVGLPAYLSSDVKAPALLETYTGGSTAQPMRFFLHRHVTRPKESAYIGHVEASALRARGDDWSLSLRGRTVQSAGEPGGPLWRTEPIKRHLIFSTDHLEAQHMPAYVEALERLRPPLIHAFPSALYPLARWLKDHPEPRFTQGVRGILLTSENVYAFQSALFREVFPQAAVIEHYGHSERVLMALRRTGEAAYRFCPLYGLPELVDEDGCPIERPGVLGEIVGTSFDNHAMPFVRYRTGDMGLWHEAPRHAGRVRFEMQCIEGRRQEFIVCADRRLVSITTLGTAHFNELSRVDSIQFEQREPGRVTLKVVSSRPLDGRERERIAAAVREKTQGGCAVDVLEVRSIERTARSKHRMLIQHLDLSAYLGASVLPTVEDGLLTTEPPVGPAA